MSDVKQLPYIQIKNNKKTNHLARFIFKKVKKRLLKEMPYHYLVFQRKDKILKIIQKLTKKYKYFLRFDIEKYYPSIDNEKLIQILKTILNSRNGKKFLNQEIIPLLEKYQIFKKGVPIGNFLGWILAGLYLLPLDFKILETKRPFLRIQDDYLIFLKSKKEPFRILKEIIEPELEKLNLKINIKKLKSGKFHQDKLEFLGFNYYGGIFTVTEEKIEEFKNKIRLITHLTKKKSIKAIIKQLNNKILGFGHYYKFGSVKVAFTDLDSFIRQRLRRYISRNKDSKNKLGNLILTNEALKSMGLKSLTLIYEKYARKKRINFTKKHKKKVKFGSLETQIIQVKYGKKIDSSLFLAIFKILEEVAEKLEQLNKKVAKIEKKWKEEK